MKDYLQQVVDEINQLQINGFEFQTKHWNIKIHSVICDTPARAFVNCVKSFSGYHGCDRCEQRGKWEGKMTYPKIRANLRTDTAFNSKRDEEHHTGDLPFTDTQLGMISQFPIDYMHQVCLGVTKRILIMWIKGPLCNRVGQHVIGSISEALIALKENVPCEFARKPRSLSEIDRWKATEYRQFLLYTGPVVLKHTIHSNLYKNFLLFSVAIHFLLNENLCRTYNQYVKELLETFLQHFYQLYGVDMAVYNVHTLIHLPDQALQFGSLDNISSFPFENYLQKLKRLVRKPEFPLQQVIRRLEEQANCDKEDHTNTSLHMEHIRGPLLPEFVGSTQYQKVKTRNFTIRLNKKDSCVQIGGKICIVQNIVQNNGEIILLYNRYRQESDFFNVPLSSMTLGIKNVSALGNTLREAKLEDIEAKCYLIPYLNNHKVAFPLCDSIW